MNQLEVLLMIRKYRLILLAVFITSFGAGVYFLKPKVLKYSADSTFYLANENLVNPNVFAQKNQQDFLQVSLVQERVFHLAYSNEMMLFLINRFDLYDHYGYDSTRVNHFARIVRMITKAIKFTKITPEISSVTVTDRNNEVAANMANAIVWKLDQMNKKYLNDKIQGNLSFYESFVKEAGRISQDQNAKLYGYMQELKEYRDRPVKPELESKPISEIEFSIFSSVSKIEDITTQLINSRNLYINALSSQQAKNLPSLVIIKRALPDIISKKIDLLIFATLLSILAGTLLILGLYLFFTFRKELHIVFGWELPDTTSYSGK